MVSITVSSSDFPKPSSHLTQCTRFAADLFTVYWANTLRITLSLCSGSTTLALILNGSQNLKHNKQWTLRESLSLHRGEVVVARNLPANHFQPFLFRILDTFGQVLLLMLVVMLPMVVMLLVLVLHVVHRERHGCIGRRLVQQNGRRWSRGAAGGGHLPNLGHCALVADRTDFVVLLHVSHAGCMSKKVCVCV